jgi:Tol biopolymer transport system component
MRRSTVIVALTVAVAALAPVGGGGGAVSAAPLNGRISFTRCVDVCRIYTANPNGSAIRAVTKAGSDSFTSDWSPDGTKLTYIGTASGDLTVWIVNADGSHPRQLTPNDPDSDDLWPRFAPGGRRIIFINCLGEDCDGGISSVRTDGTHLRHITPNSGFSYNLADQSTAGGRLTYMRWHVDGVKMAIYISAANGSHERRITPARLQAWYPDWSPAGRRIVFADEIFWDRPSPSLWTVRPNGNQLRPLTDPPPSHSDFDPAFSPDGAKVLFESDRRYDDFCCSDLYTVDADGGTIHRIKLPFDAYEPRWGTAPPLPATAHANAPSVRGPGGSSCDNVPKLAGTAFCAGQPG